MKEIKEAIEKDKELQRAISFARTLDVEKIKSFFPLPKSWESKKVRRCHQYLQSISNRDFILYLHKGNFTDNIVVKSKKYPTEVYYTLLSFDKETKDFIELSQNRILNKEEINFCEEKIKQIFIELENLKQLISKLPRFTKQAVIKEITYQLKTS